MGRKASLTKPARRLRQTRRKVTPQQLGVIKRTVKFLHDSADDGITADLEAEALRFAADHIQQELDIDDGNLAFLPEPDQE